MSIAEVYGDFCSELTYDDLPEPVVEMTKQVTLDTLGIAVGAIRAQSTDIFLDSIRDRNQDASGATVFATGEQMSPEYAAMANGVLAHSLDFDDTHRRASLHPGAPVIPTAIAAGEEVDASGRELLTAIVAGYEIAIRLGMAVDPASHYNRGFHGTSTCGLFGATAAAGMLYGFDKATLAAAFGLNGSQAAGSLQFLENGAWNKRTHPGLAAHAALLSTSFAQNGFLAAAAPIEGQRGFLRGYSDNPNPGIATEGLGSTYEIRNVGLKPYPCCRYMHAPLDILLSLAEDEDIDHRHVETVTVKMAEPGVQLTGNPTRRYPETVVDGQFDMRYGAAVALVHRDASIDTFFGEIESGLDNDLRRVIDVTDVTTAEWIDDVYPDQWPAAVSIQTTAETYTDRTEYARGEPEKPLSWQELVRKYDELTHDVMGAKQANRLRETVDTLETRSVADLVAPFDGG